MKSEGRDQYPEALATSEMANQSPDLQAKLEELQEELDNGEITQKGFTKRRTLLLNQYQFTPEVATAGGRTLQVHSPENTSHPANNSSRSNTLLGVPPQPAQDPSLSNRRSISPVAQHLQGHIQDGQPSSRNVSRPPSFYQTNPSSRGSSEGFSAYTPGRYDGPDGDYAFNPYAGTDDPTPRADTRSNTLLNSQGYFSDFAGQQAAEYPQDEQNGGGHNRYSAGIDSFSPTGNQGPPFEDPSQVSGWTMLNPQVPLEPRDLDFDIFDPHNSNVPMTKFDSIAAILRHRGREIPRNSAFMVLDSKGKELAMITWEKLATRAEKVAQVIREKSSLYVGDRVALIYRTTEIIDFAVSLLACFIAGVVAVPIVDFQQYGTLLDILTQTQTHLALTTDFNLKLFERDIQEHRMSWPKGVEWWKTDEFGSYRPKRKDEVPALRPHDIAYFEYTMAPTGEYRGIVHTHRTIMHQMSVLSALVQTAPSTASARDTIASALRDKNGQRVAGGGAGEITFSYLDPRQSIGLILGVLLTVYGGHTTVWADPKVMITPGLYANLVTRYKATLMLADYSELRRVVYNYQMDPMKTREFQKKFDPSFGSVKLCLIDTLTVDSEFHGMLADRWLRPLGNPRAREVVAPMLCLPEHGGMVVSMRDSIGLEHQLGCSLDMDPLNGESVATPRDPRRLSRANTLVGGVTTLLGHDNTKASTETETEARNNLGEVLIDKEALKTNEIVVVAYGEEARKKADDQTSVRVGAFGYPIPGASLAIVDPDTQLLCLPNTVGEIWVDSPALSGGFWSLPKLTQGIFRAVPYRYMPESPTPVPLKEEYLRTGLLGFILGGKVYVLGLYEDRLRQKVEWTDRDALEPEYRYFFIQHMITSIGRNLSGIFAW